MDKNIIDKEMMGKIVQNLFMKIPISMIYEDNQIPLQIVSATQEGIVIRSTRRIDSEPRILTFTNNGNQYHFWFELAPGSNMDLEFLMPIRMEIKTEIKRNENRHLIGGSTEFSYITNIIPEDILVLKSDSLNTLIEPIWKSKSKILKEKFNYSNLRINTRDDTRYKIFKAGSPQIFLPEKNSTKPFNSSFFNPETFKDFLNPDGDFPIIGAEISIPFFIRSKILLGYLIVKNDNGLTLSDYNLINSISTYIQGEINLIDEYVLYKEKCKIDDISKHGVGFLILEDSTLIKEMRQGRVIIFQTYLGKNNGVYFKAIIRNVIKSKTNYLRVGCEFFNQTPEEKIFIENFSRKIDSHNPQ
jgi:hypothetical protein